MKHFVNIHVNINVKNCYSVRHTSCVMSAECLLQMQRNNFYHFKKDCTKLLSPVFQGCMLSHIFRKNLNLKINVNFLDGKIKDTASEKKVIKNRKGNRTDSNHLGELNTFILET